MDITLKRAKRDDSDDDSDSDEDESMEVRRPTRNADMFQGEDDTAGQLFVFVGKSERGKTHFMRWLILDQIQRPSNPLRFGIAFVRTKFKKSYKFMPDDKIFEGYDEDILRQYIDNLDQIYEETGKIPHNWVIFDDLMGILKNGSLWFTNWIATFRHRNTSVFIAVQYLTGKHAITPVMREQTSFAFMFNSKTNNTVKNLYENYGQLFEKEKDFKRYLSDHTVPSKMGPFVCVVYNEKEDEIEKNYTPMRAPKEYNKSLKLNF